MRLTRVSVFVFMVMVMSVLAVPAVGVPSDSPFIGSWESADHDGSHVRLKIAKDGDWSIKDDAGTVCLNNGYGFVRATASGPGRFTGDTNDTYVADPGHIYCYPQDGDCQLLGFLSDPDDMAYWPVMT